LSLFDPEYIDWQGKYADFDLCSDFKEILDEHGDTGQDGPNLDNGSIFSICKVYPTEANPDPLRKVDDGDHGVGAMWVTVQRCDNLLSGDSHNGLSDPLVKLTFEDMKWITVTVQNELEPGG
jgi:hypothetical protein